MFFFALLIPVFTAQKFIIRLSSSLCEVETIDQLDKNNLKRYYIIKNYSVNKNVVGNDIKILERSGRRSAGLPKLSMEIFIVAPMEELVTTMDSYKVMYCKTYERESDSDKLKEPERFRKDALSQFLHNDNKPVTYFECIKETNNNYEYFYNAARMKYNNPKMVFLLAETTPFENRYSNWLLAFVICLAVGLTVTWFMISLAELDMFKVDSYLNKK